MCVASPESKLLLVNFELGFFALTLISHEIDPGQRSESHPASLVSGVTAFPRRSLDHFSQRVPPNVRFEVDDVEADWTYTKPFDYIHCRYMGAAISDWPRLSKQCFEYVFLI